ELEHHPQPGRRTRSGAAPRVVRSRADTPPQQRDPLGRRSRLPPELARDGTRHDCPRRLRRGHECPCGSPPRGQHLLRPLRPDDLPGGRATARAAGARVLEGHLGAGRAHRARGLPRRLPRFPRVDPRPDDGSVRALAGEADADPRRGVGLHRRGAGGGAETGGTLVVPGRGIHRSGRRRGHPSPLGPGSRVPREPLRQHPRAPRGSGARVERRPAPHRVRDPRRRLPRGPRAGPRAHVLLRAHLRPRPRRRHQRDLVPVRDASALLGRNPDEQADHGPRAGRRVSPGVRAGAGAAGARDQGDGWRSGPLPPGPHRRGRATLLHAQAAFDAGVAAGRRPPLDHRGRRPCDRRRTAHAQDAPRRDAAAHQHPARRDEHRRTAPRAADVRRSARGLHPVLQPTARGAAGGHRVGAGQLRLRRLRRWLDVEAVPRPVLPQAPLDGLRPAHPRRDAA
ncbi:MAG: Exopolysaccharide biosynthesis polyprenyl glycosylphosphotransferase, partial [uncultured Solirubrobacteraceae bacterium]